MSSHTYVLLTSVGFSPGKCIWLCRETLAFKKFLDHPSHFFKVFMGNKIQHYLQNHSLNTNVEVRNWSPMLKVRLTEYSFTKIRYSVKSCNRLISEGLFMNI